MTSRFVLLSLLSFTLAGSVQGATPLQAAIAQGSVARTQALVRTLGLDGRHTFALRSFQEDGLGQVHARQQQYFQGVRVWGGEVISHADASGNLLSLTRDLRPNIEVDVTPSLASDEALARVHADLAPKGPYVAPPRAELVVYPVVKQVLRRGRVLAATGPDALDMAPSVDRYLLAWHVSASLQNGAEETVAAEYLLDAHSGAILRKWNNLHTAAAQAPGRSQYSGMVKLDVNTLSSGTELRDMTRGIGGAFGNNVVTNLDHGTLGNGTVYTNAEEVWGDGANYSGGRTSTPNGQTAGVDAAYGMQWTWDYYKNVFGRDGIDGRGTATSMRMHYDRAYDNAFWDDTCFCMTFGDGSMFKSLEAMDVMGHEMSHGVCAATANLTYSDESGGLNEANSDIHGTMVEFYARSGGGSTIGEKGGNWTMGEDLATAKFPKPLRFMYKPSLDGNSPDAWSPAIKDLDVHYSSGPMNRAFYFLAQGATVEGDTSTAYLPKGMAGVGNDHAARIWYRAMATYLTSESNYASARKGSISAARDLYGAGSPEEQAVWNAFHGINVGPAWTGSAASAEVLRNGGFEEGAKVWKGSVRDIGSWTPQPASEGRMSAWMCGNGRTAREFLAQSVTLAEGLTSATLTFQLHVDTAETRPVAADTLAVRILDPSGKVLETLATYSNQDAADGYALRSFDLARFKGRTFLLAFQGREDSDAQTSFVLDAVGIRVQ